MMSKNTLTTTQQTLLDTLESLKVRKTKGRLKHKERYCIQGMMCEAYRRVLDESAWTTDGEDKFCMTPAHQSPAFFTYGAPFKVIQAFGIKGWQAEALAEMNDTTNMRTRELIAELKKYMLEKR